MQIRALIPPTSTIGFGFRLRVESWRKRLLDLGNRNPLINCSLESTRGAVEIVNPACQVVWRKLAADNDAGTAALRFPWRRDLVPPPKDKDMSGDRGGKQPRAAIATQRTLQLYLTRP